MENLLKQLSVKVTAAATGTIYVYSDDDIMIRIGNHEPNFSAPRRQADYEIYTHNIEGKEVNNKFQVVFKVCEILEIAVPAEITEEYSIYLEEQKEFADIAEKGRMKATEVMLQGIENRKLKGELFGQDITDFIQGKEDVIKEIVILAEAYAAEGSNGDKRRKRRRSFFKQELEKRFGCYFEISELK